jgi:hypothetical protein
MTGAAPHALAQCQAQTRAAPHKSLRRQP